MPPVGMQLPIPDVKNHLLKIRHKVAGHCMHYAVYKISYLSAGLMLLLLSVADGLTAH
jgi:hypothetical protein